MGSNGEKPISDADAELERELRQARKFSAQEAIGRLAGRGAMKGASAVPRQQQAENEIGVWLRSEISDPAGVLISVLQRQLTTSELLVQNLDQPLLALARHCRRLLASGHLLKDLVREVDAEWGRAMDERPYFEREGLPPHPADPYTIQSVRSALDQMIRRLPS